MEKKSRAKGSIFRMVPEEMLKTRGTGTLNGFLSAVLFAHLPDESPDRNVFGFPDAEMSGTERRKRD